MVTALKSRARSRCTFEIKFILDRIHCGCTQVDSEQMVFSLLLINKCGISTIDRGYSNGEQQIIVREVLRIETLECQVH